jgi:hypothetical protein
MPPRKPPERREADEVEEEADEEDAAEAAVLPPPAAPAPPALPEGDAAAWLANAQQQIALQLSHQLAHSLAQNQQTQQLWMQQALATNNQQQQQQLLTAIAQLQPAAGAAPTPTMGAATSTRPPHTLLAADLSAQQFLGIDQAQGSPAASVTSAADTDPARIADIQTTLAKAIGNADPTLRCDPTTCNLSTELWRVTTNLLRDKKLDAGELSQFNTIIGAARCFLRLLEAYSFDQENDDAIGEILERCTRDIMRIHIRASPLLKNKEQAEQLYLAACAKRDGVSGDNAIAGVAVCMPEMAEIHAKLQRDFVERGNKLFKRAGRKARSDDDDDDEDDAKQKVDKQKADKHAADIKARDRRIGELTRAFREHNLPLPPKATKKTGTATKGGKSKDREPAAADDDGDEA